MKSPENELDEIVKFNIILRRLKHDYLEIVRNWRNDPEVSRWLISQIQITSEQQHKWFSSLNGSTQYYYIIEYNQEPIGLVNLKNYDQSMGSAEGGIFIGNRSFQNGAIAIEALIAMYDFGFEKLKLNEVIAYIKPENTRAVRLNQSLGFRKVPGLAIRQDGTELWNLNKQNYLTTTISLRDFLRRN